MKLNFRPEDVKFLRRVKKFIKMNNDDHHFLCVRIGQFSVDCHQSIRIKKQILDLLDGFYCYEIWMEEKHPDQYHDTKNKFRAQHLGRIAWLDWMIEQCEKED